MYILTCVDLSSASPHPVSIRERTKLTYKYSRIFLKRYDRHAGKCAVSAAQNNQTVLSGFIGRLTVAHYQLIVWEILAK